MMGDFPPLPVGLEYPPFPPMPPEAMDGMNMIQAGPGEMGGMTATNDGSHASCCYDRNDWTTYGSHAPRSHGGYECNDADDAT